MKLKVVKITPPPPPVRYETKGVILDRPVSDFAGDGSIKTLEKIFSLIMRGVLHCEYGAPDVNGMSPVEALARLRLSDLSRGCGVIVNPILYVNDGRVVLTGDFWPSGPFGLTVCEALPNLEQITLGARFEVNSDNKITGVYGWDWVVELKEPTHA